MLEDKINQDLKAALLAGDKVLAMTLRGLKSVLLYVKIAQKGERDRPLGNDAVLAILQKEAKKRQESADLYHQGGNAERAAAELQEKVVIERYLPAPISSSELESAIEAIIAEQGGKSQAVMGVIISAAKARFGAAADSAIIARLVREKLAA